MEGQHEQHELETAADGSGERMSSVEVSPRDHVAGKGAYVEAERSGAGQGVYVEAERSGAGQGVYVEAERSGADITSGVGDITSGVGDRALRSGGRAIQEMDLFKAELLATVSHELRSPLASIKGYTATLLRHERRISREERHEFLLAIQGASNRLELIIDRLLEMSQLETGAIHIVYSTVDVARLAREAITVAQQRLLGDGVTFHLHLKDAAGRLIQEEPLIQADSRLLREVLDHLLENAVNYSPEGGTIDIIVHPLEHGRVYEVRTGSTTRGSSEPMTRQMLEICVCDHGLGIPPEHLDRVFERFHRVDTRLTREVNGLGLGLTICKHIIELHDGFIWAESCPAGGSAFHIWLPIDEEEGSLMPLMHASTN